MPHVQPRGEEKGLTRKGGLQGRTIGLRRREGREAGSQGGSPESQNRGEDAASPGAGLSSRPPGADRGRGFSGSGAVHATSRGRQGEAVEAGVPECPSRPPTLQGTGVGTNG